MIKTTKNFSGPAHQRHQFHGKKCLLKKEISNFFLKVNERRTSRLCTPLSPIKESRREGSGSSLELRCSPEPERSMTSSPVTPVDNAEVCIHWAKNEGNILIRLLRLEKNTLFQYYNYLTIYLEKCEVSCLFILSSCATWQPLYLGMMTKEIWNKPHLHLPEIKNQFPRLLIKLQIIAAGIISLKVRTNHHASGMVFKRFIFFFKKANFYMKYFQRK